MHLAKHSARGRCLAVLYLCLFPLCAGLLQADGGRIHPCADSEDVYQALKRVQPGDTILLEGGKRYEIDRSLVLEASGTEGASIRFS
ncbi:MAG: hypothetical protein V2I48_09415, partial [Xanthomonadales bacterium]|nr:hypothetical protein [Xanthomonadales bacterium]